MMDPAPAFFLLFEKDFEISLTITQAAALCFHYGSGEFPQQVFMRREKIGQFGKFGRCALSLVLVFPHTAESIGKGFRIRRNGMI